eukprot:CAMPEP_0198294992 /NCGR_PEP_ID=MMETSP1449-20131203/25218_1 /TAXON_ID=420275 /ORGANISM="Attheya septentrionalis, Strain CCMP2084" /LENGTH=36 /DNA_ID= /DNA_START= /DNA_END= /DNA_ORIENTATION=
MIVNNELYEDNGLGEEDHDNASLRDCDNEDSDSDSD